MGSIDGEIPNILFLLSAIGFWILAYIHNKKTWKINRNIFFVNFSHIILSKLFWFNFYDLNFNYPHYSHMLKTQ